MSHEKKPKQSNSTASLHQQFNPDADPDMENGQEEQTDAEKLLGKLTHKELQQRLLEAEEKSNQYYDRMLRMQAEADNTQRRVERDIANAHKYALEKFVNELLPVVDSLERSQEISSEEHAVNAVLEGIQLTLKMFLGVLEKFSVQQLNPVGEQFNPELHQAVSVQPDPKVKPNTVLSVLQKGYTLNNRLIRPALVVVSKA